MFSMDSYIHCRICVYSEGFCSSFSVEVCASAVRFPIVIMHWQQFHFMPKSFCFVRNELCLLCSFGNMHTRHLSNLLKDKRFS